MSLRAPGSRRIEQKQHRRHTGGAPRLGSRRRLGSRAELEGREDEEYGEAVNERGNQLSVGANTRHASGKPSPRPPTHTTIWWYSYPVTPLQSMSVKLATSPTTFPATSTDFSQNHIQGQLDHEDHENRTHSPQNLDLQGQIQGQRTGN